VDPDEHPLPPVPRRRSDPLGLDLRTEFYRIFGVDLTAIPGVEIGTIYTLFAECGRDLSAFPTAGDFASWLGLCPDNRITGGKVLSTRTRKVKHPLATALRLGDDDNIPWPNPGDPIALVANIFDFDIHHLTLLYRWLRTSSLALGCRFWVRGGRRLPCPGEHRYPINTTGVYVPDGDLLRWNLNYVCAVLLSDLCIEQAQEIL
jgi:hypothetical protein